MRIEASLATMIARHAVLEPYRQIQPMPTDQFVKWLEKRGIGVGDWQTLHHLWQIGFLLPVAVQTRTLDGEPNGILSTVQTDRMIHVGQMRYGELFADVGVEIEPQAPLRPTKKIPYAFRDALLWHPFQLWLFDHLDRWHLRLNYAWGLLLAGPDRHNKARSQWWRWRLEDFREYGDSDQHRSFIRLLALLLSAEPLVHTQIFQDVTLDPSDQDLEGFSHWREAQSGGARMTEASLPLGDIEQWHRELAFRATTSDPVEPFRGLLRHADRDVREKMTGGALKSHDLYDAAEVLRRYLARFCDYSVPEETAIAWPEQSEWVNKQRYGTPRPSDFQRNSFRRITRRFGVDVGYRSCLFLEGMTEIAFVERWAELAGIDLENHGIRLINLRSKDNIELFEDDLRWMQAEEVFAHVCVDFDHPERSEKQADQIKTLRRFENDGLLPTSFTIWRPNFVQHNFTIAEVVEIVNASEPAQEMRVRLTEDDLVSEMSRNSHASPRRRDKTIEKAIHDVTRARTGSGLLRKGETWGRRLADWAIEHAPPPIVAGQTDQRPIELIIEMAARGHYADYALTVEHWRKKRGLIDESMDE